MLNITRKYHSLIWQLLRRDIHSRYRGSALGFLWSLVTPLIMLGIYTFVFQFIFKARWSDKAGETTLSFAIVLFLGLSLHALLMEVFTKAPQLITANPNFVKKIVFPLEILPWVTLLSALFTFLISLGLLLLFMFIEIGRVPLTSVLLPLILLPYLLFLLGAGWLLAALGVYLRDIQQIMGTVSTLLLFLSPIFYSAANLPENLQALIFLNPLSFIVESARLVLIYGQQPDYAGLGIYSLIASFVAWLGYTFFRKVRPGFSDVL
jgi:lipopolysaccharide transport system permease protein